MKIILQKIKSLDDFEYIRKLRNAPYVRSNSLNNEIVSKNDHKNWLIKNKRNKFFILKIIKKNIGYIRINEKNYLSWALEKSYWGKIKFYEYLKKSTNSKKIKYSCIIFKDNVQSQIVALKAGFRFNKIEKKIICFQKK